LGFDWSGGGVYVRPGSDGQDSIGFDLRPSRSRFCVLIGYYPKEFSVLEELHPEMNAISRGYLCRPYLNPNGTSWHPRWWSSKDRDAAIRSLQHVLACIQGVGMAWLAQLRDRTFYAEHTDPMAALPSGFAHELAGNVQVAKERYLDMNQRFLEIDKIGGGIRKFSGGWRDCIFVRAKLGLNDELTTALRELADWHRPITPLAERL